MSRNTARAATRAFALTRGAIGVAALLAPGVLASGWVDKSEARMPGSRVLARALGGRDVALAAGIMLSLRHDAPARGWVEGAGLADAMDTLATILSFRSLPSPNRWAVLSLAGAGIAASRILSQVIDG